MKMYDDAGYARTRLIGTTVMHKRKPVKVLSIDYEMIATVVTTTNKTRNVRSSVPLEELNLLNLQLGFVNHNGRANFLARRTLRYDWRQGLRPNNVSSTYGGVSDKLIGLALMHRYPTFEKALESGANSCAWCEDFAINSDMSIVWRYDVVGKFVDGSIRLKPKFYFLSSAIKESINGHYEVF